MRGTIERGLVYVYSMETPNRFVGCGALIEGGLIATCRHMVLEAVTGTKAPLIVGIGYPGSRNKGVVPAHIVDKCDDDQPIPDLILLQPTEFPLDAFKLQLAAEDKFEVGAGYVHARVKRIDQDGNEVWQETFAEGNISDSIRIEDGFRQLNGLSPDQYWFTAGSSGSPVFLNGAMQLAGNLSLSELGANEQKAVAKVAFIVPATTIRQFATRTVPKLAAEHKGVDLDLLRSLNAIDWDKASVSTIAERIQEYVEVNRPKLTQVVDEPLVPR